MRESKERALQVLSEIDHACRRSGRLRTEVTLVAVSKTHPPEVIQPVLDLLNARGFPAVLGENYVQEFKKKKENLTGSFEVHCIGALQRNKAKDAVTLFDMIESVHSWELAEALNKEAIKAGKKLRVLFQVNISNDDAKGGFSGAEVRSALTRVVSELPALSCEGIMTITKLYADAEEARGDFLNMRLLKEALLTDKEIAESFRGRTFHLSMGMSADYTVAIEEGATLVRVGSRIFGERE